MKFITVFVALGVGVYEALGDARPSVFTFCGTLLASLLVMKKEETATKRNTNDSSTDS